MDMKMSLMLMMIIEMVKVVMGNTDNDTTDDYRFTSSIVHSYYELSTNCQP